MNSVDINGLQTTVYIWNYRGSKSAWGHASMLLSDGTYISWWPESENRVFKITEGIPIYSVNGISDRKYENDVKGEEQEPDQNIYIEGLDGKAIQNWWSDFKKNNKRETLGNNCSKTVADAIKIGEGSSVWWTPSANNIIWTPAKTAAFAQDVKVWNYINRKLKNIFYYFRGVK